MNLEKEAREWLEKQPFKSIPSDQMPALLAAFASTVCGEWVRCDQCGKMVTDDGGAGNTVATLTDSNS